MKIIIVVTGDFPSAKDDVYDKHIAEVGVTPTQNVDY